jgi:hypothetical protein
MELDPEETSTRYKRAKRSQFYHTMYELKRAIEIMKPVDSWAAREIESYEGFISSNEKPPSQRPEKFISEVEKLTLLVPKSSGKKNPGIDYRDSKTKRKFYVFESPIPQNQEACLKV